MCLLPPVLSILFKLVSVPRMASCTRSNPDDMASKLRLSARGCVSGALVASNTNPRATALQCPWRGFSSAATSGSTTARGDAGHQRRTSETCSPSAPISLLLASSRSECDCSATERPFLLDMFTALVPKSVSRMVLLWFFCGLYVMHRARRRPRDFVPSLAARAARATWRTCWLPKLA